MKFDKIFYGLGINGTIEDIGTVIGGGTPSKSNPSYYTKDGIAWLTPRDLSKNRDKFVQHGEFDITEEGLKNSSAKIMPRGTILFSSRAPIGYIAISSGQVCTNQGFRSIVPNKNIGTAYIYHYLKRNVSGIEARASGSTFMEISGSLMKSFDAVIPGDSLLKNFNLFVEPVMNTQELIEKQNRRLVEIRNILLTRLISR